ncbi:MAG TPA: hypothetical protein VLI90_13720, partial [Tepidisphaeraceae bacterium]|nr:hypothetical protein [Tepidisphaeraceae bacterium]
MSAPTVDVPLAAPPKTARRSTRLLDAAVLIPVLIAGAILRVFLAKTGHNYDMDCWQVAVDLMQHGRSVYANTARYNYGPVWMLVLHGLRFLQDHTAQSLHITGPEQFHVYVAGFLTLVDIAIALILAARFGTIAAIMFFLCPVSVLITGFHSQVDNFAVLFGLIGWCILRPPSVQTPSWTRTIIAGVVFGISLATKHLLIFFPLWFLIGGRRALPPKRALVLAILTYGVFAASFVPFALAPADRAGIVEHVLRYRSQVDTGSMFIRAIDMIVPYGIFERTQLLFHGAPNGLVLLFLSMMLVTGRLVAVNRPAEMFWFYLIALTAFSIAWADQYLTIPLVACVVYRRHWASWMYILVSTAFLITSPRNLAAVGGRDFLYN